MSQKNSTPSRKNLTVDIKMWYSEHDHTSHWTLFGYEDHSYIHSSRAYTVKESMEIIQKQIASMMEVEGREIQDY